MKEILPVEDKRFKEYGQIIENPFINELMELSKGLDMPESGAKYLTSVEAFERDNIVSYFSEVFGKMDVQIGCCWGYNTKLNALEWHKSTEINCALTDMVLMVGKLQDMEDGFYDTKNIEYFLLKAGQSVELYQTTLHFCPVQASKSGFKTAVILPKGTNVPLESPLFGGRLTHKNKWMVCHKENSKAVSMGRVVGLKGENLELIL